MEHLGGQVLRFRAIVNTARDVGVDAVEVYFVEIGEPGRVALGLLDQQALLGLVTQGPP